MFRIGSVALLLGSGLLSAQEIPLVGRPASDFYGAIGDQVSITASASPVSLTIEDTIVFTLKIEGVRNVADLPRPDLRQVAEFAKRFAIEDGESRLVGEDGRAFDYRLRPRAADLSEIPEVVYRYFSPRRRAQLNNATQWFPTTSTDPIPLMMRAVEIQTPARVPLRIPAFAERVDTTTSGEYGYLVAALVIVLPPLLCGLLHARRPRPIAHRESVQRILDQLRRINAEPMQAAKQAATLLQCYVSELNQRMQISLSMDHEVAELLRECDAVRFGGVVMNPGPPVQIAAAIERWESGVG